MEGAAKAAAWAVTWQVPASIELCIAAATAAAPTWTDRKSEFLAQTDLLRDIFGNPFRPVTPDPRWQTPAVVDLAQAIYQEKAFDRMPNLADALAQAGCTNPDILNHCHQASVHVRGCWVIDCFWGRSEP
jgi:hypothetical protein